MANPEKPKFDCKSFNATDLAAFKNPITGGHVLQFEESFEAQRDQTDPVFLNVFGI